MTVDLAAVPAAPGAYLMLDRSGRVLYVGRAGDLRQRVRTYWAPSLDRPGLRAMVRRVRRVVTVPARSEHEAAFLERALLERHDPPYNRTLGFESVVAIRVAVSAVTAVHEFTPAEGVRLFGPYLGWSAAAGAASAIARAYPLHLCRPASAMTSVERDLARRRGLGASDAPELLRRVVAVLERDPAAVDEVVARTEEARDRASELGLYERAAELQAEIAGIRWISQSQTVGSLTGDGWRIDEALLPAL